jgi:SET domain-containing protein
LIHPDSELRFINPAIGYGVFATSLIPKGTFTWVRDQLDQIVEPRLDTRLPEMPAALLHRYSYLELRGRVLCWDQVRFINHSCQANCRSTGFDLELATRDIQRARKSPMTMDR